MLTSVFFGEFSHFFENFCILDSQTNQLKKKFQLELWKLLIMYFGMISRIFLKFFYRCFDVFYDFFEKKILLKKKRQNFGSFFWEIFLSKKIKNLDETWKQNSKKVLEITPKYVINRFRTSSLNFFYLIGLKIQNTKILKKMRKFSKKRAS